MVLLATDSDTRGLGEHTPLRHATRAALAHPPPRPAAGTVVPRGVDRRGALQLGVEGVEVGTARSNRSCVVCRLGSQMD